MRNGALITLIIAGGISISCGGPDRPAPETAVAERTPQVLLVEKVISGPVLRVNLMAPSGLATDLRDNIYVVDAGNNRLVQFAPDLNPVREYGGYGQEAGLLNRPSYITFDNNLNLWVTDEGNRRVARYNTQLNYVDELDFYDSQDPLKFGNPSGLAITEYGETWVADRDNNRVAIFSNVGRFDRFMGDLGYGGGQLREPEEIVRLRSGDFVVCDAGNHRLAFYDRYGNYSEEMELDYLTYPRALAETGNQLWVIGGGVLVCVNYRGEMVYEVGPNITGDEIPLKNPSDVAALSDDRLLISDTGNNRILVCRIFYQEN